MRRFVEGIQRGQSTLFPECLEDWIDENNPVRVIDAFVDKLDLPVSSFAPASRSIGGGLTEREPLLLNVRLQPNRTLGRLGCLLMKTLLRCMTNANTTGS
jgi:hypothetical protein